MSKSDNEPNNETATKSMNRGLLVISGVLAAGLIITNVDGLSLGSGEEIDTDRVAQIADERINNALREERLTDSLFEQKFAEAVQTYSRTAQEEQRRESASRSAEAAPGDVPPVTADDWVLGDIDTASVVLVEYGSYACSFCQRAHPIFHQLVDEYQGDVAWVYRHFPLSMGGNDEAQAVAANCAGKLGGNDAFWEFSDALYEGRMASDSAMEQFLEQFGIEGEDMQACTNDESMVEAVRDEGASGRAAGVTGTPGNFLISTDDPDDVRPVHGAQPAAEFRRVIDSMI